MSFSSSQQLEDDTLFVFGFDGKWRHNDVAQFVKYESTAKIDDTYSSYNYRCGVHLLSPTTALVRLVAGQDMSAIGYHLSGKSKNGCRLTVRQAYANRRSESEKFEKGIEQLEEKIGVKLDSTIDALIPAIRAAVREELKDAARPSTSATSTSSSSPVEKTPRTLVLDEMRALKDSVTVDQMKTMRTMMEVMAKSP